MKSIILTNIAISMLHILLNDDFDCYYNNSMVMDITMLLLMPIMILK